MTLDELLETTKPHSQTAESTTATASITIPSDWTQGRTVFGGLSAALIYSAIKDQISADRTVRSLNFSFVGPLESKSSFIIEVEILRQGKNVTQVTGRAIQDSKVAVLCQACFGVPRKSKISVLNENNHQMHMPKKPKFIPQIPKVTPKFLRHFDLSIDQGSLPFTGSKQSKIHGWMRLSEKLTEINEAHIVCLIDAWPPTVLQMLRWPAPASTICWNLEFVNQQERYSGDEWFAYQATTRHAESGYANTEANIWDSSHRLIAMSRQTVGIFD